MSQQEILSLPDKTPLKNRLDYLAEATGKFIKVGPLNKDDVRLFEVIIELAFSSIGYSEKHVIIDFYKSQPLEARLNLMKSWYSHHADISFRLYMEENAERDRQKNGVDKSSHLTNFQLHIPTLSDLR